MTNGDEAHMKVIDRCIKRRNSRRPADVVDHIRVDDPAWADALLSRMEAAGYDPQPRPASEPARSKQHRNVTLPVFEAWAVMAAELATAQGITLEQFMAAILQEGLLEAFLELRAQRNALAQAQRHEPTRKPAAKGELDDDIPF